MPAFRGYTSHFSFQRVFFVILLPVCVFLIISLDILTQGMKESYVEPGTLEDPFLEMNNTRTILEPDIFGVSKPSVDQNKLPAAEELTRNAQQHKNICPEPPSAKCCTLYVSLTTDSKNVTQVKYHLNGSLQFVWTPQQNAALSLVHPNCSSTPILSASQNLNTFVHTLRTVPQGSILIGLAESKTHGAYLDKNKIVQKAWPEKGAFIAFIIIVGNWGASRGYAFPYEDQTWWKEFCFSSSVQLDLGLYPWLTLNSLHRDVTLGGSWRPLSCIPRQKLAVIIPYRDRDAHLRVFLNNMHSFLKMQNLDYTIYIVEHTCPAIFNRAVLQNIGYTEAIQDQPYNCFLFQDVDLLPEKVENVHLCDSGPKHMVVTRNSTHYKLFSLKYFGGGIMMRRQDVQSINGFTNKIWGWGGEDNNAYFRVLEAGQTIHRLPPEVASYTMLTHDRDTGNPRNNFIIAEDEGLDPGRDHSIPYVNDREYQRAYDGLSTLQYRLVWKVKQPLYTHILASVTGPTVNHTLCQHSHNIPQS